MQGRGRQSLFEYLQAHPGCRVMDFSQLTEWEACSRLYQYRYIEGLKVTKHPAADYSSILLHEPLSRWYLGGDPVWAPTPEAWRDMWAKFILTMTRPLGVKQVTTYTLKAAMVCFAEYTRRFRADFDAYVVDSSEEVYWSELPGIDSVVWLAKPDLVLKRKADGLLVSCDFKVSSWDFNENLLEFDRQFVGQAYVTGAASMMKNFFKLAARESITLNREFERVDPEQLEEWTVETVQNVKHFLADVDAGVFPKRAPGACTRFNMACNFIELCRLASARKFAMQDMEHTNPLAYLDLGEKTEGSGE